MKLLSLLSTLVFAVNVWAAEVVQVKGTKALLQVSGLNVQVGTQLYVLSSEGKKIGIVEVKQVKGGKAIAEILKGRAEVGGAVQGKGGAAAATATAAKDTPTDTETRETSEDDSGAPTKKKKFAVGALLGMAMNSFAMNIGPTTSTARDAGTMSGSGFNIKGFGDYDFTKKLTIRAAAGIETFAAKGSIAHTYCDSGTSANCSVNFMYLGLEGSGHYNYLTGKTKAWVGLGYSYLLQISSSKNIPNLDTGTGSNQMILISTGADIGLSKGRFIPIVVEYGWFPGSADVKASSIFIRGGYGFPF